MDYFVSLLLAMFSKNKMNIKIPEKLKIGRRGNSLQVNSVDCEEWKIWEDLRLTQFPVLF